MSVKVTDNPVGRRTIENLNKLGFRKIAKIGGIIDVGGSVDMPVIYAKMNNGKMIYKPCIENLEKALQTYSNSNGKDTSGLDGIFERGESLAICYEKREDVIMIFDFT